MIPKEAFNSFVDWLINEHGLCEQCVNGSDGECSSIGADYFCPPSREKMWNKFKELLAAEGVAQSELGVEKGVQEEAR